MVEKETIWLFHFSEFDLVLDYLNAKVAPCLRIPHKQKTGGETVFDLHFEGELNCQIPLNIFTGAPRRISCKLGRQPFYDPAQRPEIFLRP